jgi:ubiquinone/menaquinone biosynthesis C-methylase UbiE
MEKKHESKDGRQYWNKRAASYDGQVIDKYSDAYEETISRSLKYCKEGDDVLEIACGTGIVTLELTKRAGHVTAVDISDEMIARLKEKAGDKYPNLTLLNTDVFDRELDEKQFDVVAAFNVLLYMENIDEALERIHRLVKPGGIFLSATDCVGGLDTPDAIEKRKRVEKGELAFVGLYTAEELGEMIERAGFEILESEDIHEGTPNQYIAAKKK